MYARAIDDAALRLRELREQEWEDLGLGGLALGLSIVATQVLPSFAVPLFFGGVFVGFLGMRAVVRRWNLVEELTEESDAYVLPEVLARASREATMERRRAFAAVIRTWIGDAAAEPEFASPAVELETLACELEDERLALDPASAVVCSKLVSELCGSPLPDPELSPEFLRSRIRQIRSGFATLPDRV
jgi:hypothetical protein